MIAEFEAGSLLATTLYRLWNRMSPGELLSFAGAAG